MKMHDFENAFGEAPDSFELAMQQALGKDTRMISRSMKGLLIAAVLAILMIGTAFAATRGFGLLDMLAGRLPVNEQMENMVQTASQNKGEQKDFTATIEEAISDGMQAYFTVRIAPTDPAKTLLIPWAEQSTEIPEGFEKSYAELAKEQGKQLFVIDAHNTWTGAYNFYATDELSKRRDGDDMVLSYAMPAVPDRDDESKLTIHCGVIGYELYEGHSDRDSWQRIDANAQIDYTKDVKGYRWKNPAKIPELGVQITNVRVYDSPVTRSLQIRFKPLPGLDEVDLAAANNTHFSPLDENGNVIEGTYADSSGIESGDEFIQNMVVPADHTGGITLAKYDWAAEKPTYTLRLDVQDATPIDMETRLKENADKYRKEGEKAEERRIKEEAEEKARLSATPKPIPHDAKEVQLTGAEIPVLREEETVYKQLTDRIEALSGQVGLSADNGKYTITIDQIAATDTTMMLFYTFKGKEKLERGEDRSIKGWNAKEAIPMIMDVQFASNPDGHTILSDGFDRNSMFFIDDYTIRGYLVLSDMRESLRIPERDHVTFTCAGFHTQDDSLQVSFHLDRSMAKAGVRAKDLDVDASYVLPDDSNESRDVQLTHVSASAIMTTLDATETKKSNGNTEYVIKDDRGRFLENRLVTPSYLYDAIDADHTKIERTRWNIWGAQDAKSLTLIPIINYLPSDQNSVFVPLTQALPYTFETEGGMKVTLHECVLDTNGLTLRYEGLIGWSPEFLLSENQDFDFATSLNGTIISDSTDPITNITTTVLRWSPEKGAKQGERIKQSTLDKYKYLWFPTMLYVLDSSQAVTIHLD